MGKKPKEKEKNITLSLSSDHNSDVNQIKTNARRDMIRHHYE